MKPERLHLSQQQSVETNLDGNGRYYIVYSGRASVFRRDPIEVRQFLKLPKGIPSRESFDSWIASLQAADEARAQKKLDKQIDHTTGFGPECHLDESDPNYNTRTVI